MRIIIWSLQVEFGDPITDELEVEDNATNEEIETEVKEAAMNFVTISWEEVKKVSQ